MPRYTLTVNEQAVTVDAEPDMPLLWVLRDLLGLTGTKYSCGEGVCGACTVHLAGEAVRSCITPIAQADGAVVTTIEGLATAEALHPVQQAWLVESVAQCGYCQPGQIMEAVALLAANPQPSDADIDAALGDVLCRCGTYQRIRRAVHTAAEMMAGGGAA